MALVTSSPSSTTSPAKIFHAILNISFLFFLFFIIFLTTKPHPSSPPSHLFSGAASPPGDCRGLEGVKDHKAKCSYLTTQNPCVSQGYIQYLKVFYCLCGGSPLLGYSLLALWLLVLFYLLGNTASQYFCSSLESLSSVLRLSPTIAGVTLLSLGNGAPDVFASIVSFTGSGSAATTSSFGISSILGGAFFVSSVVVGIISISVPVSQPVSIDRLSFVRDVCFFLAALAALVVVLVIGRVNLWGAMCFVCLYLVYVLTVSVTHCCRGRIYGGELGLPLLVLEDIEIEDPVSDAKEVDGECDGAELQPPRKCRFGWILYIIELPLYLPRRLTIPVVCEEKWSKPFAVASVTLAPLLLAALWNSYKGKEADGSPQSLEIYLYSMLAGAVLGFFALEGTEKSHPPKRLLLPWLAGGFLMSVTWSYIIAGELVALLVSLGYILGISPSILGFTLLAWGNSVGDLIANVAMAMNGGQDGAQVAISGCYAGPLFNTLVGLGVSLAFSAWAVHPAPFEIPADPSLLEIIGFLVGGLLWALVMLPRGGMKLDKVLGIGLVAIYLCFLSLRVSQSLGLVQLSGLLRLTGNNLFSL